MKLCLSIVLAACLASPPVAAAIVPGQIDTFEDGTTQGWVVALLGAVHPAPPINVADGGPQGAGDNYLEITALGSGGAGSRLAVINITQWTGDYTSAGIATIAMDLRNLGATDLSIRLYLANPMGGPATDDAVSDFVFLPSGGAWTHVEFAVDPASLTVLNGDVGALLSNVTDLRIAHSPTATFPGPAIVASLGVDGIAALQESPALPLLTTRSMLLLVLLLSAVAALGFHNRRQDESPC